MFQVLKGGQPEVEFWNAAGRGKKTNEEWKQFFEGLFEAIRQGKEASVNYYNNWVEEVKKNVPRDKLLIFSVKEGWEPLCKFLDLPVPEGPFPNTNDTTKIESWENYCLSPRFWSPNFDWNHYVFFLVLSL